MCVNGTISHILTCLARVSVVIAAWAIQCKASQSPAAAPSRRAMENGYVGVAGKIWFLFQRFVN